MQPARPMLSGLVHEKAHPDPVVPDIAQSILKCVDGGCIQSPLVQQIPISTY